MSAFTEKQRVTKNERSTTAGFPPPPPTDRDVACRVRGIVEEHSLLSTAVCFGAGLAMGAVLGRVLAGTAVTLVLLYFLLVLGDRFLNNVVRIMPTFRSKRDVVELVRNVEGGVSAYLFTVSTINVCLGLVIALAMWLLGMPNPLLWGVMATLFNFIPYVGAVVGAGVVFVVAVVTFDSLLFALVIPLVYFGMTALEGSLITPSMLGRSMEMNPILVFLSLVFWGWMWGVGGALLAVPLLAVFKTTCDQFPSTKNLGTLIG